MVQRPHRCFPAPERPRRTQAKFPHGPEGAAAGRRCAGDPRRPHLPPALPRPAATGPSLLPLPPTPRAFGVPICVTCGQPQPRALLTRPADRARFPGSAPGPVPRHLAGAGPTRTDASASYRGSAEGCGRSAGADTGSPGTLARSCASVADKETLWTSSLRWARDSRTPVPSLLLLLLLLLLIC
ncbi:hypothetical protein NN561_001976 [Cricetulus griseus]